MATVHCVYLLILAYSVFCIRAEYDINEPTCYSNDDLCFENTDCCSGYCEKDSVVDGDNILNVCKPRPCFETGSICNSNGFCCSGICNPIPLSRRGVCSDTPCGRIDEACETSRDCCYGNCNSTTYLCGPRINLFGGL